MARAEAVRSSRTRSPKAAKTPDKVLQYVLSSPWAISEAGLQRVLAVASRMTITPQALEQRSGIPLDNTRATTIRDGVATIPVRGPLLRRASWFDALCGACDYESLTRDVRAALDDHRVEALILAIDSPGGEVSGCSELAQQLLASREEKPIYAYVGGDCCSAAYWLASACTGIYVSDTSLVGNIGVLMTMVDDTRRLRAEGLERITIVSSQTPAKPHNPSTEPGRERVQALVDALADVFLGAVANGRGISKDTVLAQYGAGAVFVGDAAVGAGLADEVTTYEALMASITAAERGATSSLEEFSMPSKTKGRAQARATPKPKAKALAPLRTRASKSEAQDQTREDEMDGEQAAIEEGDQPATCAECDAALPEDAQFCPQCGAACSSEDMPDDEPTASDAPTDEEQPKETAASASMRAAATQERERIVGILGYAGRFGLEAVMPFVNDPACTKEKAAMQLLEQPAARTSRLRALKGDESQITSAPVRSGQPGAVGKTGARLLSALARVNPAALPAAASTALTHGT